MKASINQILFKFLLLKDQIQIIIWNKTLFLNSELWCARLYEHKNYGGWVQEIPVTNKIVPHGAKKDEVSSIQVRDTCIFQAFDNSGDDENIAAITKDNPDLPYDQMSADEITSYNCQCNCKLYK